MNKLMIIGSVDSEKSTLTKALLKNLSMLKKHKF